MVKDSIFRAIYARKEQRLNVGYDYKDKIMKNSISSYMFGVNENLDYFIGQMDKVVYEWVESVKQIKIFANPALDKHENKIR